MPMTSRILLALAALAFLWVAVQGLADPVGLAATVGLAPAKPGAANELRASYGGQSLALAVLLALGAWRPAATRPALVLLTVLCGGLVLGRAVDTLQNGLPPAFTCGLWGFEGVMALAGAITLRVQRTR